MRVYFCQFDKGVGGWDLSKRGSATRFGFAACAGRSERSGKSSVFCPLRIPCFGNGLVHWDTCPLSDRAFPWRRPAARLSARAPIRGLVLWGRCPGSLHTRTSRPASNAREPGVVPDHYSLTSPEPQRARATPTYRLPLPVRSPIITRDAVYAPTCNQSLQFLVARGAMTHTHAQEPTTRWSPELN